MPTEKKELKVFISHQDSTCDECKKELGRKAFIFLDRKRGALCLSCADLDHLWLLYSGNAALTRRSKKYSTLWAVVLKFSRARKRYERQGLLVELEAVEKAEKECLADSEVRERRKQRNAERRLELEREYVEQFTQKVRELYPGCPKGREKKIAEHACRKYSGRVGRSAAAKHFDPEAVRLAVTAHIRHWETGYDELLMKGYEQWEARQRIESDVQDVLDQWAEPAE
jgi:hypothetical protein